MRQSRPSASTARTPCRGAPAGDVRGRESKRRTRCAPSTPGERLPWTCWRHDVNAKQRVRPPEVLVEQQLLADLEAVLHGGETVADFVAEAASRCVERRRVDADFCAGGEATRKECQQTGAAMEPDTIPARSNPAASRATSRGLR
jgi:hypothetical protein